MVRLPCFGNTSGQLLHLAGIDACGLVLYLWIVVKNSGLSQKELSQPMQCLNGEAFSIAINLIVT